MYTKQLLLGLEYLHKNGIMHRDIKATMTGAKSMKDTPYWMAPEVILQTGHSFSADIWSVGCTVIEMATRKPPWCQQYQEVAALCHIGKTKSHPPIPDHLSAEAKDFLLKCLHKEREVRPAASDLLQHPFVTGEYQEAQPMYHTSVLDNSGNHMETSRTDIKIFLNPKIRPTGTGLKEFHDAGSVRCSTIYPENFSRREPIWGSGSYDDMSDRQ